MKNSFFKIFFSFVVLLLPFIVLAGTEHNLSGWAWSDNIGWISMNSTNCDVDANGFVDSGICGGNNSSTSVINYGVNKRTDGNLVGYAWANPADDTGVVSAPASAPNIVKVSRYTYGSQDWTVPSGVTSINVKLWGAGGGNDGGGGGYTSANIAVTSGDVITMSVGQGGVIGGASGAACTGTGGGQTYIQKNGTKLLIAGGGGGGACYSGYLGGAGGGLSGQDGWNTSVQGRGGTQTAGGAGGSGNGGAGSAGSLGLGGNGGGTTTCGTGAGVVSGGFGGGGRAVSNNSYSCAGGGGGYYGGGGGGTNNNLPYGPGGGGSGFISTNSAVTNGVTTTGNNTTPANASDADRNGAGRGTSTGTGIGADGAVVISYTTPTTTSTTSNVTISSKDLVFRYAGGWGGGNYYLTTCDDQRVDATYTKAYRLGAYCSLMNSNYTSTGTTEDVDYGCVTAPASERACSSNGNMSIGGSGVGWCTGANRALGWFKCQQTQTTTTGGTAATGGGGTASTVKTNNIGWIQFGNLNTADFPEGNGTQPRNAYMDSSGNLTGWAKALSANPATGWDGFISLSGDGYGVTLTNTAIPFITASAEKGLANMFAWIPKFFNTAYASSPSQRFAWGSDVVGWVDFSGVIVGSSLTPAVTISANPTSGQVGVVNPGLTWSATNNPTSCTASGDWSGEKPVSGDNVSQGVLSISKTYTYTIACSNANGAGTPASATVTAGTPICGPGNGSTPQEFEPTGALACTYGGHNADSPPDTDKLWKWKCGTNVCSAPPYGCTIVGDDNYDANGPSNNLGCAGAASCPEGQTGTPDTICCDGTANPPQYYDGISACIGENDICPSGTSGTPVTGCVRKKPNFQED